MSRELPKGVVPSATAPGAATAGERARILLVDDDERNLLALAEVLEPLADVVTATSGRTALRELLKGEFAVILLDVFMPEMDGIETIAVLRKTFPGIRVIAMSGRPGVDYLAVARELGVNHTLRKPFDIEELLTAIAEGAQ